MRRDELLCSVFSVRVFALSALGAHGGGQVEKCWREHSWLAWRCQETGIVPSLSVPTMMGCPGVKYDNKYGSAGIALANPYNILE